MELSNEEKVTSILINKEILKRKGSPYENEYCTSNPIEYDLSLFIKTRKNKPVRNRFDSRYLFVN